MVEIRTCIFTVLGILFWWELRGAFQSCQLVGVGLLEGLKKGLALSCGCLLTCMSTPQSHHALSARTMMAVRVEALLSCSHTSFCHILMLLLRLYFLSHSSGGVQGSYGQPCMTRGDWIPFEWSVIVGETRGPIQYCECEYGKGKDRTMEWRAAKVNPGWLCYQKDDGKT